MAEPTYVLDTEPVVAYLYDEPGHDRVAEVIDAVYAGDTTAAMAEANAAEVLYKIARFEGDDGTPTPASLRVGDRDTRALERMGVAIEPGDWRQAGEIKAYGGLSLADAFGVALAVDRDATLLIGADEEFDDLPVDVELERIREEGVER